MIMEVNCRQDRRICSELRKTSTIRTEGGAVRIVTAKKTKEKRDNVADV